MVTDHISRAHLYEILGSRIRQAFEWVRRLDAMALEPGTYEIDGRRVYALVQRYETKRVAEGRWEAHRQYIDLQLVVEGRERIGFAPAGRMAAGAYDEARDFETLAGPGDFLELQGGEFMLLWPGEAHMLGMAIGEPAALTKIVVKIAAE